MGGRDDEPGKTGKGGPKGEAKSGPAHDNSHMSKGKGVGLTADQLLNLERIKSAYDTKEQSEEQRSRYAQAYIDDEIKKHKVGELKPSPTGPGELKPEPQRPVRGK